jgi:uncharacterized membrane protein YgaE (UPF0421/DUF939 family)
MKIEEALQERKSELNNLQTDINNLDGQAVKLKDGVLKYNDLKKQSSDLKKILKHKKRELDTVLTFFNNVDQSYADKIFPLFSSLPVSEENLREEGEFKIKEKPGGTDLNAVGKSEVGKL